MPALYIASPGRGGRPYRLGLARGWQERGSTSANLASGLPPTAMSLCRRLASKQRQHSGRGGAGLQAPLRGKDQVLIEGLVARLSRAKEGPREGPPGPAFKGAGKAAEDSGEAGQAAGMVLNAAPAAYGRGRRISAKGGKVTVPGVAARGGDARALGSRPCPVLEAR